MSLSFLVFALIIGVGIAWIWSSIFDTHGPWNSFFWFFAVIFLFAWGGGSWIAPFGPIGWGVAWLPIVVMGVFMALLLTAATPPRHRRRARGAQADAVRRAAADEVETLMVFDTFFWMLIVVLAVFVLGRYAWHLRPFGLGGA